MNGLFNHASALRETYDIKSKLIKPSDPKFIEIIEKFGEEVSLKEEEAQMNLVTAQSTFEEDVRTTREKVSEAQSEVVSLEGRHQHATEQHKTLLQEHQDIHQKMTVGSGTQRMAARGVILCVNIIVRCACTYLC